MLRYFTIFFIINFAASTILLSAIYNYKEGNDLKILFNALEGHNKKLDLIRTAKHNINIITYYMDYRYIGWSLVKELKAALNRGVEVRLLSTLTASLMSDHTLKVYKELTSNPDKLKRAKIFLFNPRLSQASDISSLHSKLFIVDGKIAITGGRNLSDHSLKSKDYEFLIEGPIVNDLQDYFKNTLDFQIMYAHLFSNSSDTPFLLDSLDESSFDYNENFFPHNPSYPDGFKGRVLVHDAIQNMYLKKTSFEEMLNFHDDVIEVFMNEDFNKLRMYSYFTIFTPTFIDYLLNKSYIEEKEISIITNSLASSKTLSTSGYFASLPHTKLLLKTGVTINQWVSKEGWEYLHAKVAIFDDKKVIIGSHNFDTGSTAVSNELSIEVISEDFANQMITLFEKDLNENTIKITEEQINTEIKKNWLKIKFLKPFDHLLKKLY